MKTLLAFLIVTNAFAAEHSLKAHEHGSQKLEIGIEKTTMDLDMDGPSESFIGFEHLPKNAAEKKVFEAAKSLWEKNLFELVMIDKTLGCKIKSSSFTQVVEGNHADIEAKSSVVCTKTIAGSSMKITLKKHFKNIKKLKVEIVGDTTKSVDITMAEQEIKL